MIQSVLLASYFILKGCVNGAMTGQERALNVCKPQLLGDLYHFKRTCKLNVVKHNSFAAYFILKGYVNGAITGQKGTGNVV